MPPLLSRITPRRLPAYALNGIAVAIGVGGVQLLFAALGGATAAQLASSGAVCTSLADVPNTVGRTWQRVVAAALLAVLASASAALLQPHPAALGAGVAAVAFIAMMTMAWGLRAGAVSFAPILSMIFAMALPAPGPGPTERIAWNALGAAAYIVWSLLSSAALQRAYRRLAGVDALRATARLFESRAGIVESTGADEPMQAWIGDELALAERLQSARDLVFDAPDNARSRRDTAILLQAIDLRDVLLASRLDLDLLGRDEHGRRLLERIAATLRQIARALDAAADALRDGVPPREPAPIDVSACFTGAVLPAGDPRVRLLPAIESRLHRLAAYVQRVHGLLRGSEAEPLPLSRDQLRLFVAPEGWPLAALRAQLSGQSPVLRHAVRMAVALGSSYYLAPLLPWTSHPHWLVLSVAVVLRGNLEQTLSRRNARVLGTMLGCLAVLLLANTSSTLVLTLVFLAAVGTAHSFVTVRYWVTAAAASVMALLQSHLVDPASAFAIGERVADTLLGAALAWAFSYVLPSWERRSLPQAIARALAALRGYARHALAQDAGAGVEPRLARRKAYDALGAVAAAVRRSSAEPKSVRLPIAEVSELLDHAQRLMAHLSVVRLTLARGGEDLARPEAAAALQAAGSALRSYLDAEHEPTGAGADPPGLDRLPEAPPEKDALPWLLRRLEVTVHDAWRVHGAARAALAKLRAARPPRASSPTARTPS